MAELICRLLRDGALDGEYAPALTISDSIHSPFGSHAFNYLLCHLSSNISSSKSQSRALVLITFDRSPLFYFDLLKSKGLDVAASDKWIQILDCYSDPLGWKDELLCLGIHDKFSKTGASPFKEVGNMDKLFTSIVDIGRGVAGPSKARFSVAIDSVSAMLRHATLASVSGLISKLRSHDQVSCMFWLIHSDLHELRASAALEYMSSMVATVEPQTHSSDGHNQNSRGKFNVRFKRRNGRVKVTSEEFHMEQSGIKFVPVSSENLMVNQNLIPKVQFNLHLSEKERVDKAKVVLPFEHQGNGEAIQIYDGRQSLSEGQTDPHLKRPISTANKVVTENECSKGEIHYIRDSDDETPDSDEDPDDDLDI